jgi:hypothetical protein
MQYIEIKDEPDSDSEQQQTAPDIKQEKNNDEDEQEDNTMTPSKDGVEEDGEGEDRVFSENLSEMCLCECKLCGKAVYHHQIKRHNDTTHRPAKSQYDFIRQTYYRYCPRQTHCFLSLATIFMYLGRKRKMLLGIKICIYDFLAFSYLPFPIWLSKVLLLVDIGQQTSRKQRIKYLCSVKGIKPANPPSLLISDFRLGGHTSQMTSPHRRGGGGIQEVQETGHV